jgi:hypothetical protein
MGSWWLMIYIYIYTKYTVTSKGMYFKLMLTHLKFAFD